MYQVNLLPWRSRQLRQRYRFWLTSFCVQLLVILIFLALIYGLLSYQQWQQRQVLQEKAQQYANLEEQIEQKQQIIAKLARLAAEEVRHQHNEAHNRRYLLLLQQLSRRLPDALWITELEENAKGFSLHGWGGHYAAITLFEQRLSVLPWLQNSHLTDVTKSEDGVLAFILTAFWRQE
ncbi:fimbrial assembly protein [Serratia sp. S1B]|nr:fimbrial assembly protein [Serratia sp. S1B]